MGFDLHAVKRNWLPVGGAIVSILLLAMLVLVAGCQGGNQDAMRKAVAAKENVPLKASPDYRMGAGDVLTIEVRGQPDLTKTAVVRPDGKVTLVLLDDVFVQGLTTAEIDDKVTRSYNQYIVNADVTVSVVGFNSQKVYVWGQVFRQGDQPFDGEVTLVDALARAGGANERAETKRILLTRGGTVRELNFYRVVIDGDNTDNVYLQDGDLIFVPPTVFARVGMALDNIFYPFRNLFAFLFLEKEIDSVW
jgi:protein involved in polysaccharide export with SLBB domain